MIEIKVRHQLEKGNVLEFLHGWRMFRMYVFEPIEGLRIDLNVLLWTYFFPLDNFCTTVIKT